jgi:hypothetical protein
MLIPNFINTKPVDENGNWTPEWANIMTQLLTQMQLNLSNEGFVMPKLTGTQIGYLTDADKSNGALVQDSTDGSLKYNLNGAWKTVTVT